MVTLSACSANPGEAFINTEEFIVQVHESGKTVREYKIRKGTAKFLKLEIWAQENEWGWNLTPATYIPGIVVKGGGYVFNLLSDTVVVNNQDGQYSKSINQNEYEYLL